MGSYLTSYVFVGICMDPYRIRKVYTTKGGGWRCNHEKPPGSVFCPVCGEKRQEPETRVYNAINTEKLPQKFYEALDLPKDEDDWGWVTNPEVKLPGDLAVASDNSSPSCYLGHYLSGMDKYDEKNAEEIGNLDDVKKLFDKVKKDLESLGFSEEPKLWHLGFYY